MQRVADRAGRLYVLVYGEHRTHRLRETVPGDARVIEAYLGKTVRASPRRPAGGYHSMVRWPLGRRGASGEGISISCPVR